MAGGSEIIKAEARRAEGGAAKRAGQGTLRPDGGQYWPADGP